jgi:hypothetical protein
MGQSVEPEHPIAYRGSYAEIANSAAQLLFGYIY